MATAGSESSGEVAVQQEHTFVPYRYRARLRLYETIPATRYESSSREMRPTTKSIEHVMHIRGEVHPQSGSYADAQALAVQKLTPLIVLGWIVQSLVVTSYGEKDA